MFQKVASHLHNDQEWKQLQSNKLDNSFLTPRMRYFINPSKKFYTFAYEELPLSLNRQLYKFETLFSKLKKTQLIK